MSSSDDEVRLPSGRPPWDTWNGVRVGLLTGGLITILAIWFAGSNVFWLAFVGAAIGGALGYASERMQLLRRGQDGSGRRVETLAAALVLLISVAIGISPVTASPVGDDNSIERAVEHVEVIAQTPHPMGSDAIETVREYLLDRLSEYGLTPQTQSTVVPDYFGGQNNNVEVTNVLTRIPGTGSDGAILLVAHHDTNPGTPGANDNSAAIAALLEVGRHLAENPPPQDVILLFTDGEEPTPRYGMSAFGEHPWFSDVRLAVNFEGIGEAGPPLLVELSGPSALLVDRLGDATDRPAAFSFLTKITQLIGGASTDFDVVRAAGIPGYSFAYVRGSSIYHTASDDVDSLNIAGMTQQGSLALGIATGFRDLEISGGDEAVFFAIPGGRIVSYGSDVAVVAAVAAALLLVSTIWLRATRTSVRQLLAGFGLAVSGGLIATLILTLVWLGLARARSEMGIIENLLWLLTLVAGAVGCGHLTRRRADRTGSDIVGGIALIWALLCLATGIWLVQISYLFVWPAIAAGLAVLVAQISERPFWRLMSLGVGSVATAIVLVPALDVLSQLATPRPGNPDSDLTATIAAPLLILLLALGLIHVATASRSTTGDRRPIRPASKENSRTGAGVTSDRK